MIGARVVEAELPVGQAHAAFAEDGSLREPELQAGLEEVVGDLLREVRAPVEAVAA